MIEAPPETVAPNWKTGGYLKKLPDDPWGNPYAYFHSHDYAKKGIGSYTTMDAEGVEETSVVKPWKNPKTGSFYMASRFQLFSAGPDGVFNTEDDIGNWQ